MKLIACSFLWLASCHSFAEGNRVGNGGDAVICDDSIQVLDLFESKSISDKFKSKSDVTEVHSLILEKLARLSPDQEKQYRTQLQNFLANADFKDNITLVEIDDAKSVFASNSKKCKIKQLAIRKNLSLSTESKFIIDNGIWKKLDVTNKAALMFHEVIYEHFYKLGERDSVKARKLNAYLFSDDFLNSNKADFWKLIKELKVPIYQQ